MDPVTFLGCVLSVAAIGYAIYWWFALPYKEASLSYKRFLEEQNNSVDIYPTEEMQDPIYRDGHDMRGSGRIKGLPRINTPPVIRTIRGKRNSDDNDNFDSCNSSSGSNNNRCED